MRKSVRNVFRAAVALSVLFCVLVSTFLGTSKAEYFKGLKRSFDVEISPDLKFEYFLWAASSTSATSNSDRSGTGVYNTSRSFTQRVTVGKVTAKPSGIGTKSYNGSSWVAESDSNNDYTGEGIVYQIKVPVDEVGYYTLDFTVDFTFLNTEQTEDVLSLTIDHAVGCEILNYNDGFSFGDSDKPLSLWSRNNNKVYTETVNATAENENVKVLNSDSMYQWKTLAPSRQETVSLAFKVEEGDIWELNDDGSYQLDGNGNKIERGYVLWMWDFSGLYGPHNYDLEFTNISINKTMNLDGTSEGKQSDDPYFMFTQTELINNQLLLSDTSGNNNYDRLTGDLTIRGSNANGKTSYSKGRGTYVTEATANSLGFQAESILYGYHDNNTTTTTDDKGWRSLANGGESYSNPLSIRIPLKNIEAETTYKVTFDFSIARQGTYAVADTGNASSINRSYLNHTMFVDYAEFADILKTGNNAFQSYLYNGDTYNRSTNHHRERGIKQLDYNHKTYQDEPLTKYNELLYRGDSEYETIDHATVSTVNDTYTIGNANVITGSQWYQSHSNYRNWFNAVQHTEYNGQNKINWLTFYNTTFSFNIKENQTIDDLYWVWEIGSVLGMSYYRIRLENVRIEKVVQYGSNLSDDGVKIGGVQIDLAKHADCYQTLEDITNGKGVFTAFRGQTGTGQNYQAKGFTLYGASALGKYVLTNEGNIYSPIVDASRFTVAPGNSNDYKIALDGIAVCDGGIDRYVFSVDGGVTWHDMKFTGSNATDGNLSSASKSVNQYVVGQTRYPETAAEESSQTPGASFESQGLNMADYTHVTFDSGDAKKGNFDDWGLEADLSDYKYQGDLDIIFAAVPAADTSLRCEILRVINYNRTRTYKTFLDNIVSDIQVSTAGNYLNANYDREVTGSSNGGASSAENTDKFAKMKSVKNNDQINYGIGYSRRASGSATYSELPVIYKDFPVYTTLSLSGHARVEGGVEGHYWSINGGMTWEPCGGSPTTSGSTGANTTWDDWTGIADAGSVFSDNASGTTFTSGKMLTCDLSDYVGKVVDIIVAAKPKQSDVLCPIAKIDNVAVYGQEGTFFTRLADFNDGTDGSYKKAGVVLDQGKSYSNFVEPDLTDVKGNNFSGGTTASASGKWDITDDTGGPAYTIYEVQNVDPINARFYNDQENEMQVGGTVSINGYVVCHGGVKQYKYSLDNGNTWVTINDGGNTLDETNTNKNVRYAKWCDATFGAEDTVNGCFLTDRLNADDRDSQGADYMLKFNVPAMPEGTVKNLLVVAEGNNGNLYPVLHMKVKFILRDENSGAYQMGYTRTSQDGNTLNGNWIVQGNAFASNANAADKIRLVITLPVSQVGEHTLTFNMEWKKNDSSGDAITSSDKIYCSLIHDDGYDSVIDAMAPPLESTDSRVGATWESTVKAASGNTIVFNVTRDDVRRGYVAWEWNLTNLNKSPSGYTAYYFRLNGISFTPN